MTGRFTAAVSVAASLALSSAVLAQQESASGQHVVHCYDEERQTVQTTLPHRCEGQVVSQHEAERIANEIRRARARRLHGQTASDERRTRPGGIRYGSAFPVTADGDILTARHVVENCGEITLATASGETQPATVQALSETADIALLASELRSEPFPLRDGSFEPGMRVHAIGYPEQGLPMIRPLTMSGNTTLSRRDPFGNEIIGFNAPVRRGASGGPLLGPDGAVLGLVVAKVNTPAVFEKTGRLLRDFNFAIEAGTLRAFLAEHDVRPVQWAPSAEKPAGIKHEVLRVICRG